RQARYLFGASLRGGRRARSKDSEHTHHAQPTNSGCLVALFPRSVIPAKAGIQGCRTPSLALGPCFRRDDGRRTCGDSWRAHHTGGTEPDVVRFRRHLVDQCSLRRSTSARRTAVMTNDRWMARSQISFSLVTCSTAKNCSSKSIAEMMTIEPMILTLSEPVSSLVSQERRSCASPSVILAT